MKLSAYPRITGLLLAAVIFFIDQGIKSHLVWTMRLYEIGQVKLLPFFNLTWAENRGVSLGMLTAQSLEMGWLLVLLTGTIALAVLVWLLREKLLGDTCALALVLGGALGNIRDRYYFGYVIDYADLHFGAWRPFLIFNLADAAITIGVLIILARSFLSREKPAQTDIAAADAAPESQNHA